MNGGNFMSESEVLFDGLSMSYAFPQFHWKQTKLERKP